MKRLLFLLAFLCAGLVQAMDFIPLNRPKSVLVDGRPGKDRLEYQADGTLILKGGTASCVQLAWECEFKTRTRVLGGMWERTYGDSAWRRIESTNVPRDGFMAWYVLVSDDSRTDGYGIKVQPNAFASWRVYPNRLELFLDVRAGTHPVELGTRSLALCTLVSRQGHDRESAFAAGRAFCRLMCPTPRLSAAPVYGYNDWYCAYGNNTATNFLADIKFLVETMDAQPGGPVTNRPFAIVDDGWQNAIRHGGDPLKRGGQWGSVNPRWGLPMAEVAHRIKTMKARPGLWYRPFEPDEGEVKLPIDPTDPKWKRRIREDLARFADWGMELVKIDFITYDWNVTWGYELTATPFGKPLAPWRDRTRTSAEVIRDLYQTMRAAAGDRLLIIGCNAIDHFAAGLFELQRTGDDTSGREWARTRKMGPNTLGMRAIHNGIFYLNDGDCVGLVNEGDIPWQKNRQWLDLVSHSGTALFISWKRSLVTPDIARELGRAWRTAAHCTTTGEPLDWRSTPRPRHWLFGENCRATYDWDGPND